ncbi:SoxR reducing system RseC family protein [bacterium]|nr:SoxR reducing system RseC family protein [bacterium]
MAELPKHIEKEGVVGAPEEEGVVVKIEGNMARVKVVKTSDCAACSMADSCPFTRLKRDWLVWAKNSLGAKPGDRVKISIAPSKYLLIAFLIFIFPVGALLGTYIIAKALGAQESLAVTIGVTFAFLAYFVVRGIDRSSFRETAYQIVQILGSDESKQGDENADISS